MLFVKIVFYGSYDLNLIDVGGDDLFVCFFFGGFVREFGVLWKYVVDDLWVV